MGAPQQKAFEDLKQYLTNLTTMSKPSPGATLLLYLAASPFAVSAVLVEEKESQGKIKQFPIYYVFEALSGAKLNYSELEKIAYTVVMASRKLRHYFQAHSIKVLSAQPLEAMFRNYESFGRIGKWAAELNEYVVNFQHRSTIKSQALADFIANWTPAADNTTLEFQELIWTAHCDGAWCAAGAGILAVLTPPNGPKLRYAARLQSSPPTIQLNMRPFCWR